MIKLDPNREYWTEYKGMLVSSEGRVINRLPRNFWEKAKKAKFPMKRFQGSNQRMKNVVAQLFMGLKKGQKTYVIEEEDFSVRNIRIGVRG